MSLRVRLFVLFGGLLGLLVLAEWLLVGSLTRDLSVQLSEVASSVGRRIIRFVSSFDTAVEPGKHASALPVPPPESGGPPGAPHMKVIERHIVSGSGPGKDDGHFTFTTVTSDDTETVVKRDGLPPEHLKGRTLVLRGPNVSTSIPIPEAGIRGAVTRFQNQLLLGSLGILGVGLLVAAIVADRVSAPLRELAAAARRVGEGGFGTQVAGRAGGEVGAAIGAFNRMSAHLKELEDEALALKERQHLGELGEVARGLAHALRNPLHAIGLSVEEMASRVPEGADAVELAEAARRQIRHIDESIRSFLALASGGAGAEEELDGRTLVSEVALTALQDARGRVRLAVDDGDPCRIRGIPAELRAMAQALVVNAIEASPDGEAVAVRVRAREGGGLRIEVEDAGPGLPAEVRGRLFTPHVTTKPSGSGMGLFLAHRIATTRYAGALHLSDRSPRGTLAVLELGDRVKTADA